MSMITYTTSNVPNGGDIPWVLPSIDYYEDKSVTQQSLGSQSSSSEHSSLSYDEYPMMNQSMEPMSLDTQPPFDYLAPVSDHWSYAEQPPSGEFFDVRSYLDDPLDFVPLDKKLTAVNVPQAASDNSPIYTELQDLSDSGCYPEIQSSIPSPVMNQPQIPFDQSWRTDNFPEIEISECEREFADVSSLESNACLPTITTMFSTATISTPTESSPCKAESANPTTFPTSYIKKPSKYFRLI